MKIFFIFTFSNGTTTKKSYPMIIHLENHCSLNVQKEVARLFRKILGDYLFILPTTTTNEISMDNEMIKFKMETMSLSSNSSDDYSNEMQQNTSFISSSSEKHLNNISEQCCSTNIWSKITPEKLMHKIIISVCFSISIQFYWNFFFIIENVLTFSH